MHFRVSGLAHCAAWADRAFQADTMKMFVMDRDDADIEGDVGGRTLPHRGP